MEYVLCEAQMLSDAEQQTLQARHFLQNNSLSFGVKLIFEQFIKTKTDYI